MRIAAPTCLFNERPFAGEGASLYATLGTTVVYRHFRLFGSRRRRRGFGFIKGGGNGGFSFGNGVAKTARVASCTAPTAAIAWTLPSDFLGQTVAFDVRHFLNDLENLSDNYATQIVAISGGGAGQNQINATASITGQQQREGGVVRLTIQVLESNSGIQPILVRAKRTAGPSSPADATAVYSPGLRVLTLDTPALLDSAPYTYQLNLENGATVLVAQAGISVQADATGPPVPTFVSASAV